MRALDWLWGPISPPLSASSSLLLELGAQHAESTGWTRVPPGHMHRSKGHSAKPCCDHQVLLGKLGEGCQRATSWGAKGAALLWPRSQVPSPETNTQRDAWNKTVSKQGCRQRVLALHRLGGQEIQARACGGYKSPGSSGLRSHEAASPGLAMWPRACLVALPD